MDDMIGTVNNNTAKHRFELEVDGRLAAAYYERSGNVITFKHTEVPAELGGKGVGTSLVRGALDQVRSEGLQVVAQCPFVNAWIGKHPAYADLLQS
jgi:predicted GNAT family acetyltransferase